MKIIDKGDIITLSNQGSYVVAEILDYYDEEYMMLFEGNDDQVFDQAKFVKTKKNKNNQYAITNIENHDELYKIINIFLPLFQNDYISE